MPGIQIDTNVIIDFLRGELKSKKFLETKLSEDILIHISPITIAEVYQGKMEAKEQKKAKNLLEELIVLPIGRKIAQQGGIIARSGITLPDALIAATAIAYNLTLFTRNVKHFQRIESIQVRKPYEI